MPSAVIALVHGYAEHSGRYDDLARHLAGHGLLVAAFDHRGHGRSQGRRAYVGSFDQLADDLARFQGFLTERHPELPLFHFGHSMGGGVVLLHALRHRPAVQGLILSSPLIRIGDGVSMFLQRIGGIVGRYLPWLPTVELDRSFISRDPAVLRATVSDPLHYKKRIPARTGAEFIRIAAYLHARLDEVNLPFLLLHGTADRLTSPDCSRELYQRAASKDKTLRLYEGFYHETFNEPERDVVYREMIGWIDARLPVSAARLRDD